ncbi:type II toxin-antitoxin system PemK/MazF family toxin [Cellulomonas wangsupingiae]|uniref:Type II toxin-antitoxin system PemK/MazF family toxin n=1 Tax=Cellulomonas wangsupingiae TaxID=2968085 RepID=A0ABY5K033_9CELL|nr:type II toxin-antitoxin system PemK/MazF family toxin [Cellulomonas wangsupingiae]MCC2336607.1 type II toxin-antitoxin system PemK/MazF family toxin [Cellulomonas wangsupingiae]MCM0641402.1 type II toxin-antitoxin system PemK/MazF family toxin [Cellulomonas wangsupingiae]UUI63799.1 type II toxin-antitoxin system PemK/MazF family toxin [Cellulomonas wangsupingiae]
MTDGRWRTALRTAGRRLLTGGRPRPSDAVPGRRRPGAGDAAVVRPGYAPRPDGQPDPGEVVWTWVPYEDDPRRGKDRPVLVLAVEGPTVVALMLTSRDHDRDAADEARHGRIWLDVGPGGWDPRGRPSEVRIDRLLRLPVAGVRREGAALDRQRYDEVVRAAARTHGW